MYICLCVVSIILHVHIYLYFVFVFLGVVDQHLRAWFDDKSSENYLGGNLEETDSQFLSLRPTLRENENIRRCSSLEYVIMTP